MFNQAEDFLYILQDIAAGTKVLLKNNVRADRKGGKDAAPWSTSAYTVEKVTSKGGYKLRGPSGKVLKKTYNGSLKTYIKNEVN